jgi:hypothetical protein
MSDQPGTIDTFFGFTRDHTPGSKAFEALEPDLPTDRVEEGVRKSVGQRAISISSAALVGAVAALLDLPLMDIIVRAWNEGKLFRKYLDPEHYDPEEVISIKLKKHKVSSTHRPKIDVELNGRTIDTIDFELDIMLALDGIILDVQDGKVRKVRAGRVKGECTIKCENLIVFRRETEAMDLPGVLEFPANDPRGD